MTTATAAPITLLIVDDHSIVRLGLRTLFEHVADVKVVGEAETAAQAIEVALECRPDIVLLDLRLPDESGTVVCREVLARLPQTRVIVLTSYSEDEAVLAAILAGASGYVLKQTDPDRLIDAVRIVAEGNCQLDPVVTSSLMERVRRFGDQWSADPLGGLNENERRVLQLIEEGKTNRQISETLFLSENTVKTYVSSIFQKLHVSRRAEAAAFIASKRR